MAESKKRFTQHLVKHRKRIVTPEIQFFNARLLDDTVPTGLLVSSR
jgi:hypothetical protein